MLLRCLVALVDERSVTRAARRLGTSQSALSHALARLRRRLGDPLLTRGLAGMSPTPRALEVAVVARQILDGYERLERGGGAFDPRHDTGRFTLTVPDYFERLLAPRLLARLAREAPNVCVEWRSPQPELARQWLESGEIDLRAGWVHRPWPGSRFATIFPDRLVCLVRRDHPRVGNRLSLSAFLELPHVRPAIAVSSVPASGGPAVLTLAQYLGLAGGARGRILEAAERGDAEAGRPLARPRPTWHAHRDRQLHVAMLVQSFLAVPAIVGESDCIATVPELLVRCISSREAIRVLTPPIELPALRGAMYWHERNNADPRQRWFRGLLAAVSATLRD